MAAGDAISGGGISLLCRRTVLRQVIKTVSITGPARELRRLAMGKKRAACKICVVWW